jgi:uncharacterized membrane protein
MSWIVVIVAILLVAVFISAITATRRPRRLPPEHTDADTPAVRNLEDKYARGDIEREEFERRMREIER